MSGRDLASPLAERLRPRSLDDVVGQPHLLTNGKPLRIAIESGRPHSMILWGPPGVGKTTLARLMTAAFDAEFIAISAVLGGVKDIREAVEFAQSAKLTGRRTMVFVDEVHRFNKAQQDAFLPHVESGLFVFVGATTENPSFEVNSALLSRARVYVLQPLTAAELLSIAQRAVKLLAADPSFDDEVLDVLVQWADGDARRLLNAIETTHEAAQSSKRARIDRAFLDDSLSQNLRRFDKGGDQFYDQISALHKSVRGSDPDAALYWFCRMIDAGADARYLARRIIRMASEDIGLADPRALRLALDAAEVYERLGSPEGELTLAQAVIYLACAAKSNASYVAYKSAVKFVADHGSAPVPAHLRNAPTALMKALGSGREYRYAHDEPDAFAAGELYFPDGVSAHFYQPTERGLEGKIKEKLVYLAQLNRQSRQKRGG
jgi:putative ATPase